MAPSRPLPPPSRRHDFGFWAVAYAFLVVMAFSAVPTPLYALYQARDGFSSLTVTLVFSAYAVGVATSLFLVGHLSDRDGRRRWMLTAIALNLVSAVIFLVWSAVPGLALARFVGGLGVGALTATATAWIADLHAARRGREAPRRAPTVATAANIGGIGLGPLVAGILAQWVDGPLVTPYVVSLVAMAIGLVLVAVTPETTAPASPRPAYRPQGIAVPAEARGVFLFAALGTGIAFAALGLFSSLAPAFIAGELHHTSRALAGAAAFLVFTSAAVTQTLGATRTPRQQVLSGTAAMALGPVLLVVSVWLPSPSLSLFLVGGAVCGGATGLLFKGALGTVAAVAPADRRAEALAGIFLAGYLGLTIPVVGLGLLTQLVAPDVALTAFSAALAAGALVAARPALRPAADADAEGRSGAGLASV